MHKKLAKSCPKKIAYWKTEITPMKIGWWSLIARECW